MTDDRAASIEAEGLVREFKKGPRAVDGIDLRVAPGEIYGFLGPNGAGKSTTVLMLATLLPLTGGSARVAGYDVVHEGPQVRRSIGAALQAAIGRPTVEAVPRDPSDRERMARVLERFGESAAASPKGVAVRLRGGDAELADVVRALDAEDLALEHLQLHAPSLDDVFLTKTGRSLEGAGEDEEGADAETDQAETVAA